MKQPPKLPLRERASCAKCEFGDKTANNDAVLYCRRRSPMTVMGNHAGIFPTVRDTDWCGDFREELNAE